MILNRVDLVDRNQIGKIKAWLDSRFHRYRLVEAKHGDVLLPILLSVGRYDPVQADLNRPDMEHHDHSKVFSIWSYETDQPLSLEVLREAVSKLPANIYRPKGVIYTPDAIGSPAHPRKWKSIPNLRT